VSHTTEGRLGIEPGRNRRFKEGQKREQTPKTVWRGDSNRDLWADEDLTERKLRAGGKREESIEEGGRTKKERKRYPAMELKEEGYKAVREHSYLLISRNGDLETEVRAWGDRREKNQGP